MDSGKPFEVEGRLRRRDGAFRWFLFRGNPLLDTSGRVVKWYGTNTDLEDRKRAEQALRSNEQGLRLIVDSIPGFVCTLNAAGEVELLNRQVFEYFGKTKEELKNWAMSDAVHPDDLPRVIDVWRRAVETGSRMNLSSATGVPMACTAGSNRSALAARRHGRQRHRLVHVADRH